MGYFCCCLRNECEDYVNPNSSVSRNCICPRCLFQNILDTTSIFQRGEEHARLAGPSSTQGTASFGSSVSLDNSITEMYRPPPRPLPYDANPRYICVQQDEDRLYTREKWNDCEEEKNASQMKSLFKLTTAKETTGVAHIHHSPEDEDECPTCLEEYTSENPKIVTKCSHHFHLGCIYEWMERSETCPVCGKVMAFDEPI